MATCKECLHNEMCYATHTDDSTGCCAFKDRTQWVEVGCAECIVDHNRELKYTFYTYTCSICNSMIVSDTKINVKCCVDCGAKMGGIGKRGMATCKDCLHNEMCYLTHVDEDSACVEFKGRAEWKGVRHGTWRIEQTGEIGKNRVYKHVCSDCNFKISRMGESEIKYCPICGAKMDE